LGDENFSFKSVAHIGGRIASFALTGNPKLQNLSNHRRTCCRGDLLEPEPMILRSL
jgi:hypothetical protein